MSRWKVETIADRFWPKVNKAGPVPANRPDLGECWEWTGAQQSNGYGYFYAVRTRAHSDRRLAHRMAWELSGGNLTAGLVLDHLCRNRLCVNPAHLELTTDQINIRRGESPAARRARQTHCKRGHELSAENVYVDPLGRRICKPCRRSRAEERA